ncbi:MAG: fused MFS/spermidine synthase [SAR324 cluster bacterium]|nr:fused MFS/spermidine synthase [SAR324 cluster bacterium]
MWFTKEKIVFETESLGMPVQVVDKMERRELRFGNHVVQSAISKACPDYLLLSYTRHMMLGAVLCPGMKNVLHIGLGAGNLPRFLYKYFPNAHQDIIEKSPEVISIAQQYFKFPQDDQLCFHVGDGMEIMQSLEKQYDLIFLDAFEATGSPAHLTTIEFFQLLRNSLKPDGWLVGNVWTSNINLQDQIQIWQGAFATVFQAPVPIMGNVILFGCNSSITFQKKIFLKTARSLQKIIPLKFVRLLEFLEPVDPDNIL